MTARPPFRYPPELWTAPLTGTELVPIDAGSVYPTQISLDALAGFFGTAGYIEWNAGTVTALAPGLSIGGGTLAAQWSAGGVAALGSGLVVSGGTIDLEAAAKIRSVAFPLVGLLPNGQPYNVTLTQAGTLLANGGAARAYIPTNPAAAQSLTLNTIHSGTVTAQGTISVSTGGAVTFPAFAAVVMAAGDSIQIVNQATADAAFANPCFSFQFQVT